MPCRLLILQAFESGGHFRADTEIMSIFRAPSRQMKPRKRRGFRSVCDHVLVLYRCSPDCAHHATDENAQFFNKSRAMNKQQLEIRFPRDAESPP